MSQYFKPDPIPDRAFACVMSPAQVIASIARELRQELPAVTAGSDAGISTPV
jgi:hypothetical protein